MIKNDFNKLPNFVRLNSLVITKSQIYEIPTLKSGATSIYKIPKSKSDKLNSVKAKYKTKNGANVKKAKNKSNKYLFNVFDIIIWLFVRGSESKKSESECFWLAEERIMPIIKITDKEVKMA